MGMNPNCIAGQMHTYSDQLHHDVIARAVETAADIQDLSIQEMVERAGFCSPRMIHHPDSASLLIQDCAPQTNLYPNRAMVVFLPMAAGLDEFEQCHLTMLRAQNPDLRIIAVANPGPTETHSPPLSRAHRHQIARGNVMPFLGALFTELQRQGVTEVDYFGRSWGGQAAVQAAALAATHNVHTVRSVTAVDPAGSESMVFPRLAWRFWTTHNGAVQYLEESLPASYYDLLRDKMRLSEIARYIGMLTHPSNIAVAKAITNGGLERDLDTIAAHAPGAQLTLGWYTDSEIAPHQRMLDIAKRQAARHGHRFRALPLQGLQHTACTDPELMAIVATTGLRPQPARTLNYIPSPAS